MACVVGPLRGGHPSACGHGVCCVAVERLGFVVSHLRSAKSYSGGVHAVGPRMAEARQPRRGPDGVPKL